MAIDADKVLRSARTLSEADVEMLAGVVSYVGEEPGLKGRLLSVLRHSQDLNRVERLEPVIKRLDDSEILWLSENPEQLRRKGRGRGRR